MSVLSRCVGFSRAVGEGVGFSFDLSVDAAAAGPVHDQPDHGRRAAS
jgi:hypothetical protein